MDIPLAKRRCSRTVEQIRSVTMTYGICEHASASVLFEIGKTKVLCAVTLVPGVPSFLRGTGSGWVTAEYSLLPASTHTRIARESVQGRRNGRTVEISRLIGRAVRAVVDTSALGENTIYLDCDVIQADGGTRAAAITGVSRALEKAEQRWISEKKISRPLLKNSIAAISVGLSGSDILVDLDYKEDCAIDADFNYIFTSSGELIEVQGTAEKAPISWDLFHKLSMAAHGGCTQLFEVFYTKQTNSSVKHDVQVQQHG